MMKDKLESVLNNIEPKMVEIRRKIHRYPELAFQETKTAALVSSVLEEWKIEHETGIAKTGITALVGEKNEGPVVGLRADMDALPIQEKNDHEYSSRIENCMHACGHDGHVAMALGTAMLAKELENFLPGSIKFIFQPAEEGPGGAKPMIDAGVLEEPDVDYMLALHIWSNEKAGCIGVKSGSSFAAIDEFDLEVRGKSSHGASPHEGKDAVVISSEIIQSLQNIVSRSIDPVDPAVITVGKIKGGDRRNVISGRVKMEGTVRSLDREIREELEKRIKEVVSGICQAHNVDYKLDYRNLYPPLNNDEKVTEVVNNQAKQIAGEDNVVEVSEPTMGGEDFAYFLAEKPGTMFWLGGRNEEKNIDAPHHNPRFDFDEAIMPLGVKILFNSARELMINGI